MTGQCREQDNVASLRVLVSKQDSLFVVATRFAICDIILSAHCPIILFIGRYRVAFAGLGYGRTDGRTGSEPVGWCQLARSRTTDPSPRAP